MMSKLEDEIKKQGLSEQEVLNIIKSSRAKPGQEKKLYISNKSFSYLYFSDPHIGHEQFKPQLFDKMVRLTHKYKPDFSINIGDTLEGMSGRDGHIYELTHQGFKQQSSYAHELLQQIPIPLFMIDGNHDMWYFNKNNGGLVVGEELASKNNNITFLGQMEGDLNVDGIKIKLFHGNDGTAYANSYKLQKLVESFTGGEKPNIVHSGHYHKALYQFTRNIHAFESGTLCGQSRFMRGKKIPAHMGFGFVTVYYNKKGVERLVHEFVPGYE